MNYLEELNDLRKQLDALEARIAQPQEVPPVFFMPKVGEDFSVLEQNTNGEWESNGCIERDDAPRCTQPVLHPHHAERYCEAMNTLAKLRAESDEVAEGKLRWGVSAKGEINCASSTDWKYIVYAGIFKNSHEALESLLAKHNVTPGTVAKMLRFTNGDKTAGDW